MTPKVSIIMGSTSDMKVMEAAAAFLDEMEIPYEINALSAHRVPEMVADFAKNAHRRGIRAIIAGAGGAAHLPDSRPYAGSRNRRADQVVQLDRRLGQYPVDFADALGYSRGDHGAGRGA